MKKRILINRVLISIGTIFLIITISFFLVNSMPGDPLVNIMGDEEYYKVKNSNPELLTEIAEKYGLNDSLPQRYFKYLKSILTLDFGYSYVKNQPVLDVVLYRLKWTLLLAVPATILSALIGGWLGIAAGWNSGGALDRVMTPVALVMNTIPTNCVAILVLAIFAYRLRWFPVSGMTSGGLAGWAKARDVLWHMALPLLVMVLSRSCGNFIHMKSYVTQIKSEEYILTAKAKGVKRSRILRRHVLKNCFLPYITVLCMQFGHIVSGSIMVEVVFTWVGMGDMMNSSISSSDFPMMQLCFLITAVCMVLSSIAADVLYVVFDPRIEEF
ncbi:MAG: ABC transporter permease [Candidatus Faecousia sp.]|nr:ABC transporter permease [Clostridiales bacterium]MDY6180871.1 ABC transporter permease [Candidatus Faecousia sp.]